MRYFFALLSIAVILFTGYLTFQPKSSPTATRLECQKKQVVFERTYYTTGLQELLNEVAQTKSGLVTMKGQKSQYMSSRLFEKIDLEVLHQYFITEFGIDNFISPNVKIDILVYENDKLDPGKKTPKAKMYAGYLVFDFKYKDTLVYKVQIDFMKNDGSDIKEKIDCAIESIKTLND